jgi:hypothetical protein
MSYADLFQPSETQKSEASLYGDLFSDADQAVDQTKALDLADKQLADLFGETVTPTPKKEYSLAEQAIGAGENVLSAITGATTGALGHMAGTVAGIPKSIIDGDYGTREGIKKVADSANSVGGLLTYAPRSEAGKEYQQAIGDVYNTYGAPLEALAGLGVPAGPMSPMIARNMRKAQAAEDQSISAAKANDAVVRAANATTLPMPFEGSSSLSRGQTTRDFEQLQFENEQAKIGTTGEPIRNHRSSQADVFAQNLDHIQETVSDGLRYGSDYEQGQAVAGAVNSQKVSDWQGVSQAYDLARSAKELDVPVNVNALPTAFEEVKVVRHISPEVDGIIKAAQELDIIKEDGSFNSRSSVDSYIKLRETITQAMPSSRSGRFVAKKITEGIDADLSKTNSGPLFKAAQKKASEFYRTYDENPVFGKITEGAAEKIYQAIRSGEVDKITAVRDQLYKSENGIAQWKGIQGRFVKDLIEKAFDVNQRDANGKPIIKPAAINKWIEDLERTGKMDLLFDKQTQEYLYTLRDLSQDLFTAPQGSINWSNTSSAIMSTLAVITDLAVTMGTGVPAPLALSANVLSKNRKNKKLQKKIDESINYDGSKQ